MANAEIVERLIEEHNDSIDAYINITLPKKLRREGYEVIEGRISLDTFFAAQRLLAEAHFCDKANALCSALRAFGYDVKHDMQSDKLIWNGGFIE